MFKINNDTKEIDITRGDVGTIVVTAKNDDGTNYTFQVGDIVRFNVFRKKDVATVELQKNVTVKEETIEVNISLTGEDTKIGELINKPTKYWYEVELNPETNPQTIIGYDEDGEKVFMLYPEGDED